VAEYGPSYDHRTIGAADVQRVCSVLCEDKDIAAAEALFFMERFGMIDKQPLPSPEDEYAASLAAARTPGEQTALRQQQASATAKLVFVDAEMEPWRPTDGLDKANSSQSAMSPSTTQVRRFDSVAEAVDDDDDDEKKPARKTDTRGLNAGERRVDVKPLSLKAFKQTLQAEADTRQLNRADFVFVSLEDPTSSSCSLGVAVFILLVILLSSAGGVFETLPQFSEQPSGEACTPAQGCTSAATCGNCEPTVSTPFFRILEVACTLIFTVEYLLRLTTVPFANFGAQQDTIALSPIICPASHPKYAAEFAAKTSATRGRSPPRKFIDFLTAPMNLVDLLAILPFYVVLATGTEVAGLNVVRLLRLTRVFRMTKTLDTYRAWVELLVDVVRDSLLGLRILGFVFFLGLVLFASLLFFTEQGRYRADGVAWGGDDDGGGDHGGVFTRTTASGIGRERSSFVSIPRAMWAVMVTGPTTGYGDLFPTSKLGKVIGTCLLLTTLLVVAFPVTIVAQHMSSKYLDLVSRAEPPAPYDLAHMVAKQRKVTELLWKVTDQVAFMRDRKLMDDDDAYWVAQLVTIQAEKYAAADHRMGEWDSTLGSVMSFLGRQPEGPGKEVLRLNIFAFVEATLR